MNCSTTRCTTPAAAPQSGRGESALPQRPGTQTQLPFAALPHELRKDPRLKRNRTAIVLAAALLEYAPGYKPYCYPTNARLCADLGCCETTIRTALTALQKAGWIRIDLGANQPNGRRIWLQWRVNAAAHPTPQQPDPRPTNPRQPATRQPTAPRPTFPGIRQVLDTPQSAGPPPRSAVSPPRPTVPAPQPVGPKEEVVIVEEGIEENREAAHSRPRAAAPTTAPQPARTLPFDLRAIGQPATLPATPPRSPAAHGRRPRLGLTLEELAKVAGDDPILAAELARKTAPPPPAEPPPATVPTAELLAALPGRHDLIMVVARRLCEETGDYKVATQRTFEQMAEAVATRVVPATILVSCWRQALGPKAAHKGKVLVAAWQRESQGYGKPLRC